MRSGDSCRASAASRYSSRPGMRCRSRRTGCDRLEHVHRLEGRRWRSSWRSCASPAPSARSLDAEVEVFSEDETSAKLKALGDELRFLLIVSQAQVKRVSNAAGPPVGAIKVAEIAKEGGVWIRVQATAPKCERCWHHRPEVGSNPEHPTICGRCVDNLDDPGEISDLRMNDSRQYRWLQWHPLVVDLVAGDRGSTSSASCGSSGPWCSATASGAAGARHHAAHNTGAAFSFWRTRRLAAMVLSRCWLSVSRMALVIWLRKLNARTQGLLACGLALILGGAIGNVIDRLEHGLRGRLRPCALESRITSRRSTSPMRPSR